VAGGNSISGTQGNGAALPLVSGVGIALILVGAIVALPAFIMGSELNRSLGTRGSIIASLGGGFVLACIAGAAAVAGARARASSYELIVLAFGDAGGKLVNAVLSVVMVGWFAVVVSLFGDAVLKSAGTILPIGAKGWVAIGSAIMIATTLTGFRALQILSTATAPLKILLLAVTVAVALMRSSSAQTWAAPIHPSLTLGGGVSYVVGGVIVGALLTPDVARLATSLKQALLAAWLAFAVGLPLALVLAGIPAQLTGQSNLIEIMLGLGLGLPAILVVILSAWSSNTYNLYAITLVYKTLANRPTWQLATFGGTLGAAMALAGIARQLTPYLLMLGVAVPPIAGVYLAAFYTAWWTRRPLPKAAWHGRSIAAWVVGVVPAALEGPLGFSLSGIVAVDSLVVAILAYLALHACIGTLRRSSLDIARPEPASLDGVNGIAN
jgi:cytosine permease